MSDLVNAVKLELDTLTDFQKMLHMDEEDGEEIPSRFAYNIKKTTWSQHATEKMTYTAADNVITYKANHKFNFLHYTYIVQNLPALKVLAEYEDVVQICWPHNVNHNTLPQGSLRFDDDPVQRISSTWLDVVSQFYMKPGFRKHYNIMAGNVPFLEEWRTVLPAFPVITPLPWYYSRNTAVAIPLFLCTLSRVTHSFEMRNKISDVLRMRVRASVDEDWIEIPYNYEYLEGVVEQETIPKPEMWAKYSIISKHERKWAKSEPYEVYTEDIIEIPTENSCRFGASVTVKLHSDMPAKAIFWLAENIDAKKMNNYSNYTTNSDNLFLGWNPISSQKLMYGGVEKIPKMDHLHFDRVEPWYKFTSPPVEPGYNAYSVGYDVTTLHADVGMVYSSLDAKMTLILEDTNPFLSKVIDRRRKEVDNKSAEGRKMLVPKETMKNASTAVDTSPNFMIRVLILVSRKVVFRHKEKVKIVNGSPIPVIVDTPFKG